jgi:hypothetical protein
MLNSSYNGQKLKGVGMDTHWQVRGIDIAFENARANPVHHCEKENRS